MWKMMACLIETAKEATLSETQAWGGRPWEWAACSFHAFFKACLWSCTWLRDEQCGIAAVLKAGDRYKRRTFQLQLKLN